MKKKEKKTLTEEELRKRLAIDAFASPGGLDTTLTFVGQPVAPIGTNLSEKREEEKE